MENLTKSDLDTLEELLEKATQGKWKSDNRAIPFPGGWCNMGEGAGIIAEEGGHENQIVVGGAQDEQGGEVGFVKNEDAEVACALFNSARALIAAARRDMEQRAE